ncbi:YidH family protein [Nocardia sp. FBN12]|uniref:YidH family protein n=1 Tax=Nocardia sp. FBN12 TaxID=3419766 RepID=UPI003CFEF336
MTQKVATQDEENRLSERTGRSLLNWALLRSGEDPDPRFTLANERTYLAWIRTATALVAAGLGLEAFSGNLLAPVVRSSLAALLLVVGGVIAVASFAHWIGAERALRTGRRLPTPVMAPVVGGVLFVCAAVLTIAVVNS